MTDVLGEVDDRCMGVRWPDEGWCDVARDRHSIYCGKHPTPARCVAHGNPVGSCLTCERKP